MSNARSMANGIVNSTKNINIEVSKKLDFLLQDLLYPQNMTKINQMQYITKLGFKIAHNKTYQNINYELLTEILTKRRKNSP